MAKATSVPLPLLPESTSSRSVLISSPSLSFVVTLVGRKGDLASFVFLTEADALRALHEILMRRDMLRESERWRQVCPFTLAFWLAVFLLSVSCFFCPRPP